MTAASVETFPPERHGFTLSDLHDPHRLAQLDGLFRARLLADAPALSARFEAYRAGEALPPIALSALLVEVSRPLSWFLGRFFDVEEPRERGIAVASGETVLFRFRWSVFQRRTAKKYT